MESPPRLPSVGPLSARGVTSGMGVNKGSVLVIALGVR